MRVFAGAAGYGARRVWRAEVKLAGGRWKIDPHGHEPSAPVYYRKEGGDSEGSDPGGRDKSLYAADNE